MRHLLLVILTLTAFSPAAFGWGCQGHEIVALIARAHLDPGVSAAVDALLAQARKDPGLRIFCSSVPADPMAAAATWADDVRFRDRLARWHYVDIPLGFEHKETDGPTPLAAWCPPVDLSSKEKEIPGCVVNAIAFELSVLRNGSLPAQDRADALRYVIHFVGDIHMPLHDTDNRDQGGNCTTMTFFSPKAHANLHSIWDYRLLERDLDRQRLDVPGYARMLDRDSNGGSAGGSMDPVAWAWEGHEIARRLVYGGLRPAIPLEGAAGATDCEAERAKVAALHIGIEEDYFTAAMPAVREQLTRGGYRLAGLLNQAFANAGRQ